MNDFSIAFPDDRRFDDRALFINDDKDNGPDFEAFVFEVFATVKPGSKFSPRLTRGRDGAIDLVDDGVERCVVECKFIGKSTDDTPGNRWRKVSNTLQDNLRLLAAAGNEHESSQYWPWFDTLRPVRTYRFCHSAVHPTQTRLDELRRSIEQDFSAFADIDDRLRHLRDVRIEVYAWDYFHGQLRLNAPLRVRWFADLPPGIEPLRSRTHGSTTFKAFLSEDTLPFFSRAMFAEKAGSSHVTIEEEWADVLSRGSEPHCLLVAGPGGVGKTRLAIELGRRLEARGWLVVRLSGDATGASIEAMLRTHAVAAQILFILDYAEATANLSGIVASLRRAIDAGGHHPRLVATCRASALQEVRDALADLDPLEIRLSHDRGGDANEDSYARWVVERILEHSAVPDPSRVASVCDGLPVLAAFAVFLFKRAPDRFAVQFGQLLEVRDFKTWANRRIVNLISPFPDQRSAERLLASFALMLPAPGSEIEEALRGSSTNLQLWEAMRADRWVERDGESFVSAHDVFADALASRHVFGVPSLATDRLSTLLEEAASQDRLARALVNVNRLAATPGFTDIKGRDIIDSLLVRQKSAVIAARGHLVRGRLLTEAAKIQLLDADSDLREAIAGDRDCDGAISFLAEHAARRPPADALREMARRALGDLLERAVAHPHPSNMVLRRAFALDSAKYKKLALDQINSRPTASQTHYLIVEWLRLGLAKESIQAAVSAWLAANASWNQKTTFVLRTWIEGTQDRSVIESGIAAWVAVKANAASPEAQFVYSSWLDVTRDHSVVESGIAGWLALEINATSPQARFVYKSWLDATQNRDLVEPGIAAWLAVEANVTSAEASFVYRSWLDATQDRGVVESGIATWLAVEANAISPEARFVYTSWLDATQDRSVVESGIAAWLAVGTNAISLDARFIYRSWLDATQDRSVVESGIVAWLAVHANAVSLDTQFLYKSWLDATRDRSAVESGIAAWLAVDANAVSPVARFVYQSWLDATQDRSVIESGIVAWLAVEANAVSPEAQFVYKPWLDATQDRSVIEEQFGRWLALNGENKDIDYLAKAWLETGGNFAIVRSPVLRWLERNGTNAEAVFVLKYVVKERELPTSTIIAAAEWCNTFAGSDDAIWRVVNLSRYHVRPDTSFAVARAALSVLLSMNASRLSVGHATNRSHEPIQLANFAIILMSMVRATFRGDPVFADQIHLAHIRLLRDTDAYRTVQQHKKIPFSVPLTHHVADLLHTGRLSLEGDWPALDRFAGWLRAWPELAHERRAEVLRSRFTGALRQGPWADMIPG